MGGMNKHVLTVALILLSGCGQSQQFTAVPPVARNNAVPRLSVEVTAQRFKFTPEVIRVKAGTLVRLNVTSLDGTHGFQLGAFGIDERIDEDQTKIIEFYASTPGEFGFRCSHICGIGHLGMMGKVIVE
jgi:cytochrome c oxidase subunit II